MAFGGFSRGATTVRPMSEINMIPLIDVMLVLLVIFIITAPLLTNAVKIDLPQASSAPNLTKPDNIQLAIHGDGALFWNGERIDRTRLRELLRSAGALQPQPELHVRADKLTPYEKVAQALSDAAKAGVVRIAFVTDPTDAR
jgi:biopolymer transport protein ExbD